MTKETDNGRILPESDGSFTASYGPFILKTALQPIFAQSQSGQPVLRGMEGLLRLFMNDRPFSPSEFFARIGMEEKPAVDGICRQIHLQNASLEPADDMLLFLNFDPGIYPDNRAALKQLNMFTKAATESRYSANQIVCELTEHQSTNAGSLVFLSSTLREHGFKIAVDDFGSDASDMRRIALLNPDIVKLDAAWSTRLMQSQSGFQALKDAVKRFQHSGASVVVEGLEKDWQLDLAWGAGANLVQGFILARPEIAPTNIVRKFDKTPDRTKN